MKYRHNPEAFRNREDILDNATWADVTAEVEAEHFGRQISLHFDVATLDTESQELIKNWQAEIFVCVREWSAKIKELIREDNRISERMRIYLEDRTMELPRFDLYTKGEADALLNSYGFTHERVAEKNFLVVFNLPKPLSQYWWKGGVDLWGTASKDTRKMVIEWGDIYRKMMPVIWGAIDRMGAFMERINPGSIHDPKRYYYLWEMGIQPTHRYDDQDSITESISDDELADAA